jgi:hypothetical protein
MTGSSNVIFVILVNGVINIKTLLLKLMYFFPRFHQCKGISRVIMSLGELKMQLTIHLQS